LGTCRLDTVPLGVDPRQVKEEVMTLIARLFVRGAAAAGTIGTVAMLALAPQPGVAHTFAIDDHSGTSDIRAAEPAPSAACVAAKNALVAAFKADAAEDTTERNLARSGADTSNDPTEDQAERANVSSLRRALVTACEAQEPAETPKTTPTTSTSPACTAAKTALKTFFTQLAATAKAEWTNHTEGTSSDQAEDQAAIAQAKTLFQAAATACGFNRLDGDAR
jgi:hypothetical protein